MRQGFVSLHDKAGWLPLGRDGLVHVKILTNSLDPTTMRGVRVQTLRFAPGGRLTDHPDAGEYWQEFILSQGSLTVGGVRHVAPAHATVAHGMDLGAVHSEEGCLLTEIAHY